MLKKQENFTFTHSLYSFIIFVSVIGVIIFNILDSTYTENLWEKSKISFTLG